MVREASHVTDGAECLRKKEDALNEVIECPRCAYCAAYLPAGFTSTERLYCTHSGRDVDDADGCTFGAAGAPMRGSNAPQVDIGSDAAVRGCYG